MVRFWPDCAVWQASSIRHSSGKEIAPGMDLVLVLVSLIQGISHSNQIRTYLSNKSSARRYEDKIDNQRLLIETMEQTFQLNAGRPIVSQEMNSLSPINRV